MINETRPEIYIACLAAYNNGKLHGQWIDATQGIDAVQEEIQTMLANSPEPDAEEFALHDYQGFGGIQFSEYESIETLCDIAEFIEEHGEDLAAGIYCHCSDLEEAVDMMENHYRGEYDSEVDYAMELFDECYAHEIPENMCYYIDYEKFARDLFICDYFSIESNSGVYVFSNY